METSRPEVRPRAGPRQSRAFWVQGGTPPTMRVHGVRHRSWREATGSPCWPSPPCTAPGPELAEPAGAHGGEALGLQEPRNPPLPPQDSLSQVLPVSKEEDGGGSQCVSAPVTL